MCESKCLNLSTINSSSYVLFNKINNISFFLYFEVLLKKKKISWKELSVYPVALRHIVNIILRKFILLRVSS